VNSDLPKYLLYKVGLKSNQNHITQLVATVNILQIFLLKILVIKRDLSLKVIIIITNEKMKLKHDLNMRIIRKQNENNLQRETFQSFHMKT
jgi:hypothetical protein